MLFHTKNGVVNGDNLDILIKFKCDSSVLQNFNEEYRVLLANYSSFNGEYGASICYSPTSIRWTFGFGKGNEQLNYIYQIDSSKFLTEWHEIIVKKRVGLPLNITLDGEYIMDELMIVDNFNAADLLHEVDWKKGTPWVIGGFENEATNLSFTNIHRGWIQEFKINCF
ncbi:MAG: hypothetical protein H6607_12465 [Flavobacteriales bacterium]|nr:hypothetical protein [Flavobacteriales bacterium]